MKEAMEETEQKVITCDEPNYRGYRAMPFVLGNETFEKLGTVGSSANLLVYLTTVFNMSTITATNLLNIFNGTCNFGPVLGAFLCDTYFGRYKTLGLACISSFLGMLILALTAAISKLRPPPCGTGDSNSCVGPTAGQMAFLLSAFALLVVGASGIRPCNLAFGVDQFNPKTESGKRGIGSFFNWYYLSYTFAMMVSLTIIVYVQSDVSWVWGLAIPAFLMFCSCSVFFIGTRIYVMVIPHGSPFTSVVQVIVAAIKKRKVKLPEQQSISLYTYIPSDSINSKLPSTDQFRYLNKASIITLEDQINPDGSAKNPWRLSSTQQVEEVKCVVRVLPIWASGIIYYVAIVQQQTYMVFQALQSDRHLIRNNSFEIPAASYVLFSMLTLTIWIPIYDRIVVPMLRRFTKHKNGITVLQKMAIGMVLAILTMLVSALVEGKRRELALNKPTLGVVPRKGAISSMSGLWLVPQLALAGLSEAFNLVGQIEFFYMEFPENMKSIGGSFFLLGIALSSYLSSFLVTIVHKVTGGDATGDWLAQDLNKARLDYFYYLVAALEVINLGYFLVCAKWYKYKDSDSISPDAALEKVQPEKHFV